MTQDSHLEVWRQNLSFSIPLDPKHSYVLLFAVWTTTGYIKCSLFCTSAAHTHPQGNTRINESEQLRCSFKGRTPASFCCYSHSREYGLEPCCASPICPLAPFHLAGQKTWPQAIKPIKHLQSSLIQKLKCSLSGE